MDIKFRWYDRESKEMFYGAYLSNYGITDAQGNMLGNDYETVMQYVGMQDKNNISIYIADIVEAKLDFGSEKVRHVVEVNNMLWGDNFFQYEEYSNGNIDISSIKVIGNIYQNPRMRKY